MEPGIGFYLGRQLVGKAQHLISEELGAGGHLIILR
jgi:hypothetical protein